MLRWSVVITIVILMVFKGGAQSTISTSNENDNKLHFELGVREEFPMFFKGNGNRFSIFNPHFVPGIRINNIFKANLKIGIFSGYSGGESPLDFGLSLDARYHNLKGFLGVSHLQSFPSNKYSEIEGTGINIGAGYYFTNNLLLDIYYYIPFKKSESISWRTPWGGFTYEIKKLKFVSVSLQYNLPFFPSEERTECSIDTNLVKVADDTALIKKNYSRFEMGISSDLTIMNSDYGKSESSPLNFHLLPGYRFNEYFKISFRIGTFQLLSDVAGMDYGPLLEGRYQKIFAVTGINFLHVAENSHGMVDIGGNGTGIIFGAGIYITEHFLTNMYFYSPVGKSAYGTAQAGREPLINHGFLSIGVQYNFLKIK